MMLKAEIGSYRDYLRTQFERRQILTPSYTLRAYAKDLGLSAAQLSEVLSGKHGLSRRKAASVASRLGLDGENLARFCDQVDAESGRSEVVRQAARSRLEGSAIERQRQILEDDIFSLVADWYHMAILSLTEVKGFKSDESWIAQRLGISRQQVAIAIQRLLRLGLLEYKNKRLVATHRETMTPDHVPSEARRLFQAQILQKARRAQESQALAEREIGAMIMTMRRSQLAEAKRMIREFRLRFAETFESGPEPADEVYCLSTAFFRLSDDATSD